MKTQLIEWAEQGRVPDFVIRAGIRRLLRRRLRSVDTGNCESNQRRLEQLIEHFSTVAVAPVPEKANQQHYEIPAELYELTLGPRRKYSSCYWPDGSTELSQAEDAALEQTCQRADLQNGMDVLELGCGWGSLSLWILEKYPDTRVTCVSNSHSQKDFIEDSARQRGFENRLNVVTCDMNEFQAPGTYDRIVSVEMFEHMRNYRDLMRRIAGWLKDDGKLFVHIFCHKSFTYEFHDRQATDWMSRYFFTGGVMPSDGLLERFQDDLQLEKRWRWNGTHYQLTCEAWLQNMDANKSGIMPVLNRAYGQADAERWFNRWRIFYLACSELFGFRDGNEWWVAHYLFGKRHATGC